MPESEYTFRPFGPEDRPFVESSWASSYYSACRIKDLLSPDDFHAFHRPLRARFFERPTSVVIIACMPDNADSILGWVAVEGLPNCMALHYVYVKSTFRGEYGIFRELLARSLTPGPVLYTHCTPRFQKILRSNFELFRDFQFVPHLT